MQHMVGMHPAAATGRLRCFCKQQLGAAEAELHVFLVTWLICFSLFFLLIYFILSISNYFCFSCSMWLPCMLLLQLAASASSSSVQQKRKSAILDGEILLGILVSVHHQPKQQSIKMLTCGEVSWLSVLVFFFSCVDFSPWDTSPSKKC